MSINTIPRAAVKVTLHGLRLPITGIEALAGQRGNDSWPPAILFDGFEAGAKQVLGSLLRDEELTDEGRLQQAKVRELRRAVELETEAEQRRVEADRTLQARRDDAARQRRHAEEDARRRKGAIERDRAAEEAEVKRELDAEEAAVEESVEAREELVEEAERRARLLRVDLEAAALQDEAQAIQTTKAARELADAVDDAKARRKRG